MSGFLERPLTPAELWSRGLNNATNPQGGSFTPSQNRATLIVGLVCASISLFIGIFTLRWFLLMRRLFRHRLILLLVSSDALKAIWYFVFGVVTISGKPVTSHSGFCQASGYLLVLAMEASDAAILIIALHTVLCIFKPSPKSGEGGLYPYRHWIIPFWLFPPILAASLAFINGDQAYVTAGTFCFLPKRPFWYRLALSWIPRYVIVILILVMYAAIYIYVHVKFRGFKNLQAHESSRDSVTTLRRTTEATVIDDISSRRTSVAPPQPVASPKLRGGRPGMLRGHSHSSITGANSGPEHSEPWDAMNFITNLPLTSTVRSDNGSPKSGSPNPAANGSRKDSQATTQTSFTSDTAVTHTPYETAHTSSDNGTTDHLRKTRTAIRKQLRFLFIYPLLYILMWAFPFANHLTMYSNYLVQHPIYWLSLMSTMSLAFQAGVNGLVFSVKEKPWRRIDSESRFSVSFRFWEKGVEADDEQDGEKESAEPEAVPANTPHWWEAEGRKRKDSVWMGTDVLTTITSRKHVGANTLASINERSPI